jgi:hypothetical protein
MVDGLMLDRIAHSRDITKEDKIRLELHSNDIIRAIEKM